MKVIDALENRRTYYNLDDNIDVSDEKVVEVVEKVAELVPDAMNMRTQRVLIVQGEKHKELWDAIYDVFGGQVKREKIDSFKNGAGTVLFFYNSKQVRQAEKDYPLYKENFEPWAHQANGMLQINVWTALEELGLGANLQHYNPVIDEKVKEMFDVDEDYVLLSQMVYGNIFAPCDDKEGENIKDRVKVVK